MRALSLQRLGGYGSLWRHGDSVSLCVMSTTEGDCFGLTRFVRQFGPRERTWGRIGLSANNMGKQRAGLTIRLLLAGRII